MITPKDKALTPVEQAPAPLVSDERLTSIALGVTTREQVRRNRELQHLYNARYLGASMMRDIYESELTKMRAERDELVGVMNSISITAIHSNTSGQYEVDERLIGKMNTLLSKYKTE